MFGKCSEDEDKLIWKASKGDNFSVNHSFSTLESDGGVSFHSKVVWSSQALLKVGFFAWEAAWERTLTLD